MSAMSSGGEQLTLYAKPAAVRSGGRCLAGDCRLRPLAVSDQGVLAQLFFDAYAPEGCASLDAAVHEIAVTFAGEYGELECDSSAVLLWGDRVVGSVMVVREAPWSDTRRVPFVIEVMVHPEFRRRGLAECGLRWAVGRLADRGEVEVGLRVMSENEPAVALYGKLGFAPSV